MDDDKVLDTTTTTTTTTTTKESGMEQPQPELEPEPLTSGIIEVEEDQENTEKAQEVVTNEDDNNNKPDHDELSNETSDIRTVNKNKKKKAYAGLRSTVNPPDTTPPVTKPSSGQTRGPSVSALVARFEQKSVDAAAAELAETPHSGVQKNVEKLAPQSQSQSQPRPPADPTTVSMQASDQLREVPLSPPPRSGDGEEEEAEDELGGRGPVDVTEDPPKTEVVESLVSRESDGDDYVERDQKQSDIEAKLSEEELPVVPMSKKGKKKKKKARRKSFDNEIEEEGIPIPAAAAPAATSDHEEETVDSWTTVKPNPEPKPDVVRPVGVRELPI